MRSDSAVLLLCGFSAFAQEGNRLQDIQVQSLPGQRVELKLIMSGTAPEPLAFTIEDPARIALDLPETALGLSSRRRDVNLGSAGYCSDGRSQWPNTRRSEPGFNGCLRHTSQRQHDFRNSGCDEGDSARYDHAVLWQFFADSSTQTFYAAAIVPSTVSISVVPVTAVAA